MVDDDADDRDLFNEAMWTIDSSIVTHFSENGQEALDMLAELTELPQIIFLDINMPVMDGWNCLRKIKSNPRLQAIHVMMYSTSALQKDLTKARDLGVSWFIMKPNGYEDLKNLLAKIVGNIDNGLEGLKNDKVGERLNPYLIFVS